jgi:hypothetical protein
MIIDGFELSFKGINMLNSIRLLSNKKINYNAHSKSLNHIQKSSLFDALDNHLLNQILSFTYESERGVFAQVSKDS